MEKLMKNHDFSITISAKSKFTSTFTCNFQKAFLHFRGIRCMGKMCRLINNIQYVMSEIEAVHVCTDYKSSILICLIQISWNCVFTVNISLPEEVCQLFCVCLIFRWGRRPGWTMPQSTGCCSKGLLENWRKQSFITHARDWTLWG